MHERSLALRLIEQVDDELAARSLVNLNGVRISIGEFAGIEPALLVSAFEELSVQHWDREVPLTLDVVPLTASCNCCGTTFRVERFKFVCPDCHSGLVQVIHGEEIRLISLSALRRPTVGKIA
jgi:hydrogenase nickel incorporation protein HypA/HybF